MTMICANDFPRRTDSDTIEAALQVGAGGTVVIPARRSEREPERTHWLLDRAILIPGTTTLVLDNCRLKLSDAARDNFIRSANCGMGLGDPKPLEGIHIRGIGTCVLEGAEHPRSTGDSTKRLACPCPKLYPQGDDPEAWAQSWYEAHCCSYGTDAGRPGESQCGDWRNVGILLANVRRFSIKNLRIVEPHGWGISLEGCAFGSVRQIDFSARMMRNIDGMDQNVENQDGLDLRNGCHDIIVSDLTGTTGDDVLALTAIVHPNEPHPGGAVGSTHVMHNDFSRRAKDIWNVIIRNLMASSGGGMLHIRLLATGGAHIRNVVIDGLVDSSPEDFHEGASIMIGERNTEYGAAGDDAFSDIAISNVITNARAAIRVLNPVTRLRCNNILNRSPGGLEVSRSIE